MSKERRGTLESKVREGGREKGERKRETKIKGGTRERANGERGGGGRG